MQQSLRISSTSLLEDDSLILYSSHTAGGDVSKLQWVGITAPKMLLWITFFLLSAV